MSATVRRWGLRGGLAAVALLVAIQLVPYGRTHTNPPVTDEAPWPSDDARNLAVAACYDCHSNETEWPFYANLAPMSWLIVRDVEDGRESLNFSTWDESDSDAGDAAEELTEGSMPPGRYLPLHPDARLSNEEKAALVAAFESMDDGEDHSGPGRGGEDDEDDDGDGTDESDHRGPG
ncbi:MAG: heme-binding domain-containing protein [Acidimicrobiales bacterium]|nr:heme-binding domain-containing protein [Acidimicrobiales bacterium]